MSFFYIALSVLRLTFLVNLMVSLNVSCYDRSIPVKSHALSPRVPLSLIILTLTQQLTNSKISVKIIKLPKQNWFAQYGNSVK